MRDTLPASGVSPRRVCLAVSTPIHHHRFHLVRGGARDNGDVSCGVNKELRRLNVCAWTVLHEPTIILCTHFWYALPA